MGQLTPLSGKRTALLLYAVLLVLPTVVLSALLWHQLWRDHLQELEQLPVRAERASERLVRGVDDRMRQAALREQKRPIADYAERSLIRSYGPGRQAAELLFDESPLCIEPRPAGLLGWFAAELNDYLASDEPDAPSGFYDGRWFWSGDCRTEADAQSDRALREVCRDYLERWATTPQKMEAQFYRTERRERYSGIEIVAIRSQTTFPTDPALERYEALLDEISQYRSELERALFEVEYSRPWTTIEFVEQPDGSQLAVGIVVRWLLGKNASGDARNNEELAFGVAAFADLPFSSLQGWVLDLDWLINTVTAEVAIQELGEDEVLIPLNEAEELTSRARIDLDLLEELEIDRGDAQIGNLGKFVVTIDDREPERRFRSRVIRFVGVALMLALTLVTGLWLLLSGVRRELETAEGVQNFVAAVTHELRTPLSTIALHAEMLQAGWAVDDAKREEYYARIAEETERLSDLVERVLLKSNLSSGRARAPELSPAPADLSRAIELTRPRLLAKRADDVRFELGRELPQVMLTQEAVDSIVVNLVENARKYAPVAPGGEPILVRTALEGGNVVLEIADRGRGIPPDQRERVFEAFYRVGNERTRTTKGTGLGLHLVELQVQTLGGTVRVTDRPGGGALFRIELPALPVSRVAALA